MYPVQVTLLAQIAVELPFVLFSSLMLICVLKKIRQNTPAFVSDFFILYAIQGVVDLSEYAMYLTVNRLMRYGLLPFLTGWVDPLHTTHVFLSNVQVLLHVAIALNRFTAFASASFLTSTITANPRKMKLTVLLVLVLALLPIIPALFGRMEYHETATPPTLAICNAVPWAWMAMLCGRTTTLILTTFSCFYFNMRTLMAYRALMFAVLQAVSYFMLTCLDVAFLFAVVTSNSWLVSFLLNFHLPVTDVVCLNAPLCLFITSKFVRNAIMPCSSLVKSLVTGGTGDHNVSELRARTTLH